LNQLKIQINHIKYQGKLLDDNNIEDFKSYIGLVFDTSNGDPIFEWNRQTEKI